VNVYGLIGLNEGNRLHMYDDATGKDIKDKTQIVGNPTIGRGHNLFARPISQRVSDLMLEDDVNATVIEVSKSVPFFVGLDDVRQAVLVDMAYNMGVPKLLLFHDMMNCFANGDWQGAAREMRDSKWAKQTDPKGDDGWSRPDRLEHMVLTGTWPDK
jgi:lysozyme